MGRRTARPSSPRKLGPYDSLIVPGMSADVVQIAVGGYHVCALTKNGTVVCDGAVPHGLASREPCDLSTMTMPRLCRAGEKTNGKTDVPSGLVDVVQIEAGATHTCAITTQ